MLSVDFIWDDFVIGTDIVRSLDGLRRISFSPADIPSEGYYWPLTYTSFWLEDKLWRGVAAGYDTVNVLLHLANTLLLWQLLRRLAVPGHGIHKQLGNRIQACAGQPRSRTLRDASTGIPMIRIRLPTGNRIMRPSSPAWLWTCQA